MKPENLKYLIILLFIFNCKVSNAQINDTTNHFGLAFLNSNIKFTSEYELNSILKKYDLGGISRASVGWGAQLMAFKNWIGIQIVFDYNVVSTNFEKVRTMQNHISGCIGPAFKVSLNKKSFISISPYYSYNVISTGIYFYQDILLSEQVFEDNVGNVLTLDRSSHAIGFRLSWRPYIGKRQFLFSVGYSYDLLPSSYGEIGITESSDFPSEQTQNLQLTIGIGGL